jgi:NADPH:quinone reductase-like Zn-dependent oxidoreductase
MPRQSGRLRARRRWKKLCLVRAAVLHEHGGTPRPAEFDEPSSTGEEVLVDVAAAGLHHLDLFKSTGAYYTGPPPLPSVVGTDGVGRLADGRRVYFDQTVTPYGSMCERTLVPSGATLEVAEGVDDIVAAALGNTGLGAWLALGWRAGLNAGETVCVLGATGAAGTIAVQAAKLLGAGKVIAAALPDDRLARLRELGPDAVVELGDAEHLTDQIRAAAPDGVNVTIDLLWGDYGLAAMRAAARFARHIEMGSVAGADLVLPGALMRSSSLEVRGFSIAHPPLEVKREGYLRLTEHAARGDITVDVEPIPLVDVSEAWERRRRAAGGPKLVIVPSDKAH